MSESVLVTGSSGMIGTALGEALLERGHEVTGVDVDPNRWNEDLDRRTHAVDLRDPPPSPSFLEGVDTIVHLAAHARVYELVKNPRLAHENAVMTNEVLEWARRHDISRVVLGSSREVYGDSDAVIHSERETFVRRCESPYTASKVGSEAMLTAYQNCYGIDATILRFSNVYGRYDASDRVVPLFVARALDDDDLTVYGEGKVLDFTYVDDVVTGIRLCLDNPGVASGETFNVASGEGSSLTSLAEHVTSRLDTDASVVTEPSRPGEVTRFVADISKARRLLGYEPSYSLAAGVDRAVEWYRDRGDVRREVRSAE